MVNEKLKMENEKSGERDINIYKKIAKEKKPPTKSQIGLFRRLILLV